MNTILIGFALVGGFVIWKFIIEPRMNAGKPIKPSKDYKTFGEKMDEEMKKATDTNVDF